MVIVLDLGGVIVDHSPEAKAALKEWKEASGDRVLSSVRRELCHRYGCGQISTEDFLSASGLTAEVWNSLHAGIPAERMGLLRRLAERYPLYLLSNNDELHWQHVLDAYPELPPLFRGCVLSQEVGVEKPDLQIYRHTEQLIRRQVGDEIWFVDDRAANREAAEMLGWHTCESIEELAKVWIFAR